MEMCPPIRPTIESNTVRIDLALDCFVQAFAVNINYLFKNSHAEKNVNAHLNK
jgi:hypothetical protein